jgi:energy-coupling factor transporter transmembrane protein EcfT
MHQVKLLSIIKIILLIYIIISPFLDYKYFTIANTFAFKLILIIVIAAVSFIDLQLAILLTLAFLILVINLNVPKSPLTPSTPLAPRFPLSENFAVGLPQQTISEFPDKCNTQPFDDDNINTDMYNIYIDPKIKPYENYIKQLSSPDLIEKASGFNIF